jgi:hypothetical protein
MGSQPKNNFLPEKKVCFYVGHGEGDPSDLRKCKQISEQLYWPTLKLYARGYPRQVFGPASMQMGVIMCEDCKDAVSKEEFMRDFLPKENVNKLRYAFNAAGMADPDFDHPEIEWSLIE